MSEQIASADVAGALPAAAAADVLAATTDPSLVLALRPPGATSLEGLLFPDTYQVSNGESPAHVLGRMIGAMERVANQGTGRPTEPLEKVVTMPGLDKLHKLIRELQGKLVMIDGDEHALHLALGEIEREAETEQAAIRARRAEITDQMRRHQETLVEAMKQCGIMASIPNKEAKTDAA